jgi:hypothetical protein
MKESRPQLVGGWTVRRATLIDVPAVARMLKAPALADWPLPGGVTEDNMNSATRLMLTHIGLEFGEFWVAAEHDGRLRAAVVLLPPVVPGGPDEGQQRLEVALRVELGVVPGMPDLTDMAELAALVGVPDMHWLLMPLAAPDDDAVLTELLEVALPAVDDTGMPVMCLEHGEQSGRLASAGFEPLDVPSPIPVAASFRPGVHSPDDAASLLATTPS